MTLDELRLMTKEIDSLVIVADTIREMQTELIIHNPSEWVILRGPMKIDDKIIAVIIRPSK